MNRCYYALLLLLTTLSASAQTIYKEFEVDSVAKPHGGLPLLEKFIEVNRRMPYAAEVARVKGTVILSAVVEPTGAVSDVTVLRSLHPDCDREAMRVFHAFKAWKPALKGGQPVRQVLSYTIRFTPAELDSREGKTIRYFNKKGVAIANETMAEYQFVTFVDSLGYPNAAPVIYRKAGKNWKEFERYQFKNEPFTHHNNEDPSLPDSVKAYQLEIFDKTNTTQETVYSFFADGSLLSSIPYANGTISYPSRHYYRNGIVRELEEAREEKKTQQWIWHPNGQLYQVGLRDLDPLSTARFQLLNQWDSLGRAMVVNGNGQATFESRTSTSQFLESGAVKNGLKDGEWIGRRGGKLEFRETYSDGKCLSGKFYTENGDSLTYTEPEKHPEFKGGMPAMGRFLASTIRYPVEAARAKVQGRVFVSFIVDTEGNVDKVKVLKGVGSGADEEAVRVVKATSGKWIPAEQRGKKVRVRYNLPINFHLE